MYKRIFSHIILKVHLWKLCGPFKGPKCYERTDCRIQSNFFFGQLPKSQIFEIWFSRREEHKVYKIVFLIFLLAHLNS
jgi:hypothetical protein